MRTGVRRTATRIVVSALAVLLLFAQLAGASPRRARTGPRLSLDMGYARRIVADLTSIGSTDLGFRVFGTPEDRATASYIASEMRRLGLDDVGLEPVVGDAWDFEGASVALSGGGPARTLVAGSHGGVDGTPRRGVAGRVVFAGFGTAQDYERLDVNPRGKIVFAWWDADLVWTNHMAYEAKTRGAKALVVATPPGGAYYQAPGAIGSFDATCDPELCAPFVTISTRAAQSLERRLRGDAAVRARVVLRARNRLGATGYNTIGSITGSVHPEKVVVIGAHHDAWWRGAVDATSGVALTLALAKAIEESGYQPRHTWVFATHTGEEYGLADAYYDWLYGAWWRITHEHPEWQRKAAAFFNFEGHGFPYRLRVNVTQELDPFLRRQLESQSGSLPAGHDVVDIFSWNEAWTFGAAGVPSLTFATGFEDDPDGYERTIYHTQLDTVDRIDFEELAPIAAAEAATILAFDRREVAPYSFRHRLETLRASIDDAAARRLGASTSRLRAGIREMAAAWRAAAAAADDARPSCRNRHMREAVRRSLTGFTALNVWDETIYPHEQVQSDAVLLTETLAALAEGRWRQALEALLGVAQTWYVPLLSKEPFQHEMSHHARDYSRLSWGGQGKLPPYLDTWQAYRDIAAAGASGTTDFSRAVATLESYLDIERAQLRRRLRAMVGSVAAVTAELRAAAGC